MTARVIVPKVTLKQSITGIVLQGVCQSLPLPADVFNMPAGLRSLETVVAGDPGNPADNTGV